MVFLRFQAFMRHECKFGFASIIRCPTCDRRPYLPDVLRRKHSPVLVADDVQYLVPHLETLNILAESKLVSNSGKLDVSRHATQCRWVEINLQDDSSSSWNIIVA